MSDFTDRMEILLKEKKITQAHLADNLQIRKATISDWKRNSAYPTADIAVKIAKALDTTVEYLVTGEDVNAYKEKYDSLVLALKNLLQ
jgi:transcriptional regulator with XRE-family HTH domain